MCPATLEVQRILREGGDKGPWMQASSWSHGLSPLQIARAAGLDRSVHQALAPCHAVEEELLWESGTGSPGNRNAAGTEHALGSPCGLS